MKELTKKIVILNNFSSPYVSRAIIILKDYNPQLDGKAIEDAEMIVSKYIEKIEKSGHPVKNVRKKRKVVKIVVILAAVILFCAAVKYLK